MLFKSLTATGLAPMVGYFSYNRPWRVDGVWVPGEWTRTIQGQLQLCANGYHLAEDAGILDWLSETLYVAEAPEALCPMDGDALNSLKPIQCDRIIGDTKIAVRRCRLLRECNYSDSKAYAWLGEHILAVAKMYPEATSDELGVISRMAIAPPCESYMRTNTWDAAYIRNRVSYMGYHGFGDTTYISLLELAERVMSNMLANRYMKMAGWLNWLAKCDRSGSKQTFVDYWPDFYQRFVHEEDIS